MLKIWQYDVASGLTLKENVCPQWCFDVSITAWQHVSIKFSDVAYLFLLKHVSNSEKKMGLRICLKVSIIITETRFWNHSIVEITS